MRKMAKILVWMAVAVAGSLSLAAVALHRGEAISAMWLVVAALCTYALGYRFYSKFIAAKVLTLDAMRATPAERLENGRLKHTSATLYSVDSLCSMASERAIQFARMFRVIG